MNQTERNPRATPYNKALAMSLNEKLMASANKIFALERLAEAKDTRIKELEALVVAQAANSLAILQAALDAAKQAVKDRAVGSEIFVENAVDAIDGIDKQTIID